MTTEHKHVVIRSQSIPMARKALGTALILAVLALLAFGRPVLSAEGGAVTDDNLAQSIASATTAADHEALAAYFRGKAAESAERVKRHEAMIKSYEKIGGRPFQVWKPHCDSLIHTAREAQKD
ncbi:MAG TPA: hypothetical protein VJB15_08195, partial [Rhodothermia bacterium]|nr:hypothetical protein [Rhodothermia bacterium]